MTSNSCKIFAIFDVWASFIFVGAAQLVMILRVWALYHRSTVILVTLLILYTIEFILYFVAAVIISIQVDHTVTSVHVLDFSFCKIADSSVVWNEIMNYVQLALGTLMCLLIAIEFMKQSLQIYKVTKQFQLSCYINLLTREGMVYFLFVLTCAAIALAESINLPTAITLLDMIEYIPTITLIPRFIIGLRKVYAHDLRNRHGSEIDTAFGLTLTSGHSVALSTIIFEDTEHNVGLEQDDEVQMEEIHNTGGGA